MTRIEVFARYLDATGYELSPLAWHMSGLPLNDEQHNDVARLMQGEYRA